MSQTFDLNLTGKVAAYPRTAPIDVARIKRFLVQEGFYEHGTTPSSVADGAFFRGLEAFQQAAGVPVTGELEPGDATNQAMKDWLHPVAVAKRGPMAAAERHAALRAENNRAAFASVTVKSHSNDGHSVKSYTRAAPGKGGASGASKKTTTPVNPASAARDTEAAIKAAKRAPSAAGAKGTQTTQVTDKPRVATVPKMRSGPDLPKEKDRKDSILSNTPGKIVVKDNPKANPSHKYESRILGRKVVKDNDAVIVRQAKAQGVDPDLVRAIVWAENALGHKGGVDYVADAVGVSDTIHPMNINPKMWGGLNTLSKTANDPETNIRMGVTLIKRIQERTDHATPAKVGTLYHGLAQDVVDDYGAYVEKVYFERPWEK